MKELMMWIRNFYPKQVAVNDYFIQDPRYLQTYADFFCKFVSAYQEEGVVISRVMFQKNRGLTLLSGMCMDS